jgi:diguanylate cyclase (GGDEF)-like protein/PAS domain S-box-containing protein
LAHFPAGTVIRYIAAIAPWAAYRAHRAMPFGVSLRRPNGGDKNKLLKQLKRRLGLPAVAGLLAGLIGLTTSVTLAQLDNARERAGAEAEVLARLSQLQTRLATVLRTTFSPTDSLVHLIAIQGGIERQLFDALAERLIRQSPSIRNIAIAPDDQVSMVSPLRGNEPTLGFRYASQPAQFATVRAARELGQPVLSGPVNLIQGGTGFIQRYPVFVASGEGQAYWGVVSIVAHVDRVLAAGGVTDAPDLNLAIVGRTGQDGASEAHAIFGDPNVVGRSPVQLQMDVPGGSWELRAAPKKGWPSTSVWASAYLRFGMLNSILLGGLVFLLIGHQRHLARHNRALSAEMEARRKSEASLAEEEARFQQAFEASPDPTWIISEQRFVACNDAAVRLLGYASREILANTHPSALSPELQPDGESSHAKAELMMKTAEERGVHRFEWVHRKADGGEFPAEVTLSRMMLKGRPVIYCVWRDISGRKEAEAKAQESQRLLFAIVDNAPALISVFDTEGRLLLCNRQFEKAVRHQRAEILGQQRPSFLPADVAAEHLANDRQVLRDGNVLSIEESNLEDDGVHTYLTVKCPLYGSDEQAIAVVGISTDITARKKIENELLLASTVYDNTADGIVITEPDGTIVSINRAFTEITGYSEHEAVGAKPSILKSERQQEDYYQRMWASLRESGVWQGEIWNRRKNGELFPEWLTITALKDPLGEVRNYVGVFSDISAIKRSQADLERLAHFDPLTDLPNRVLFHDRLSHAFERAERYHHRVAVMLLDLDGFKTVNDSLGHPVGDRLLQLVAERLKTCVRVEDTVSRLGGDEFAIILAELDRGEDVIDVARKILLSAQKPFDIGGHSALVTTSIGIAVFPDDGQQPDVLLRNADAAMYQAKESGRNTYRYYQQEMTQAAQKRLASERALRRGIENREFEVWYQPQVCLASGQPLGAEALVRWRDPERGLISPLDFIPLAETTGLIVPLGEQVIQRVCQDAWQWLDAGLKPGRLGINVAGPQLYRSDFVGLLRRSLEQYGLPPSVLEIEVTETFMLENPAQVRQILDALQAMGVTTAIDDFGTGYSSLSYLKQLPIDTLKIDRSFVADLPDNPHDVAITRAIVAMGRSLGFNVIAEGIETPAQRDFLQSEGCAEGQGYLFAKPMPANEYATWMRTQAQRRHA